MCVESDKWNKHKVSDEYTPGCYTTELEMGVTPEASSNIWIVDIRYYTTLQTDFNKTCLEKQLIPKNAKKYKYK